MIEIKKAFQQLSDTELNELLDAPVWLSLLAAYSGDGTVSRDERAEAVKLAHLRTFTSPKSLREFYSKVDERFERRFDKLNARLPENNENRILFIEAQVKHCHKLLREKVDKDLAVEIEESIASFYNHVFKADRSFFQYFALPIISGRLDKSNEYDFDKDK